MLFRTAWGTQGNLRTLWDHSWETIGNMVGTHGEPNNLRVMNEIGQSFLCMERLKAFMFSEIRIQTQAMVETV